MGPKLAAAFRRRNSALDYDQALTFGEWRLCQAIDVLENLNRNEHTVAVRVAYSYDNGTKTGEWVYQANKMWMYDREQLVRVLHSSTYAYVAMNINNDHCVLMLDLKVKILSITDNNRKEQQ